MKQRGPGAVAGPLAGMHAPQRVSAPPSSGLATAPLWPDPSELCPFRPAFLFPVRTGVLDGEVSRATLFPFFSPFGFFESNFFERFSRLGLGLGLDTTLFFFSPNHLRV